MSFQVMLQQLTTGFGQTLLIFFLTLLFSLPLGMVVYFGRVSRFKPLSWIVKAYISIMRGTPLSCSCCCGILDRSICGE